MISPRSPFIKATILLLCALSLIGATPAHPPHQNAANWNAMITLSPLGGHVIGNPAAPVKIIEYMSYTCPHCAEFEINGVSQIRLGYVATGKVSFEVRDLLRDALDATVAQLTNCAPPGRFMILHEAFLHSQPQWTAIAMHATEGQTARWSNGNIASRRRAIARDLGFYTIMENHGIDRIAVNRCLADEGLAKRLVEQTEAGDKLGINSTPNFILNGLLLAGTYSWSTLEPQIQARLP